MYSSSSLVGRSRMYYRLCQSAFKLAGLCWQRFERTFDRFNSSRFAISEMRMCYSPWRCRVSFCVAWLDMNKTVQQNRTTGRVVRCGIPSIIVPVLPWYDQQGWGLVLEQKHLGVHLPLGSSTLLALKNALTRMLDSDTAPMKQFGKRLKNECGEESASRSIMSCICTISSTSNCIGCLVRTTT